MSTGGRGHDQFLRADQSLVKIHNFYAGPFIKLIVSAIENKAYPDSTVFIKLGTGDLIASEQLYYKVEELNLG